MTESSQASGSQSAEPITGVILTDDARDTTATETSTKEGVTPKMEYSRDIKSVGLTKDGKQGAGDTDDMSNHSDFNSGDPKESKDHGECKPEKQEDILGVEDEKHKNDNLEKERNVEGKAEVFKCEVNPLSREYVVGDKLEVVEDLNDIRHVEEEKNKGTVGIKSHESQVSQLKKSQDVKAYHDTEGAGKHEWREVKSEKLKNVKYEDKPKRVDANDLHDSRYKGNWKTEEHKRKGDMEGDLRTQLEEGLKKQLRESDVLDKAEDADNVMGKADKKGGAVVREDKTENLEKKFKGKKHSEKLNEQGGIDSTGYTQDVKGEARKSKNEEPVEILDNTEQLDNIAEKNKEYDEHDAEGTELEKLEEQYYKNDEGIYQEDEMSADQIKQKNIENDKEEEDDDSEDEKEAVDDDEKEKGGKRKLFRRKREKDNGEKERNGKKSLHEEPTPGFLTDRPVRERKTVVRLLEVIEKEQDEGLRIEKGRGIPLKDIPNVAYKLARRRPEDIKLLHLFLFGRKGKATDFKSHISQFSGFVWPENEEKQKMKFKEKLDKCAKPKLLDWCDLFDISISKATAKKEEVIEKILDFLIAPHPINDVKSSEKEQLSSVKRKRSSEGSLSDTFGSSSKPLKKRRTGSGFKNSIDIKDKDEKKGEEDKERKRNSPFTRDESSDLSGSRKEIDSVENVGSEDHGYSGKKESKNEKNSSVKKSPSLKKTLSLSHASGAKKSAYKVSKPEEVHDSRLKVFSRRKKEETHDSGPKVFSRRKKVDDTPIKQSSMPDSIVKDIGKKSGNNKSDEADKTEPKKDELRKMISVILKEVDFNTATFKDILRQLGTRLKTDLAHRKEEIKVMTKEELVKIAEEAYSNDEEGVSCEEENAQPAAKKIRT